MSISPLAEIELGPGKPREISGLSFCFAVRGTAPVGPRSVGHVARSFSLVRAAKSSEPSVVAMSAGNPNRLCRPDRASGWVLFRADSLHTQWLSLAHVWYRRRRVPIASADTVHVDAHVNFDCRGHSKFIARSSKDLTRWCRVPVGACLAETLRLKGRAFCRRRLERSDATGTVAFLGRHGSPAP